MPVIGYGVQTGIHPDLSIRVKSLLDKPAICWANVGFVPKDAAFNRLKTEIKNLCGFGWANNIDSLHYYEGADCMYRFPFSVQIFFKESKNGNIAISKSAYKYEITVYDPVERTLLISRNGELSNWNSKINKLHIDTISNTMKLFVDKVLNTKDIKDKVREFKKDIK